MKSSDGGSAGRPEKRVTARSNDPHQALTGVERPRKGARTSASAREARTAAAKYEPTWSGSYVACSSSWSSGVDHGVSCGRGSIVTGPATSRTAAKIGRAHV